MPLESARDYIEEALDEMHAPRKRLAFSFSGVEYHNIEVVLRGTVPAAPQLVVGAHYDTVAETPGADDNASAVATLLELARALRGWKSARTLRLVFFPNEEPPFFFRGGMGSEAYARQLRVDGVGLRMMLSLEMLGYYDERPGSQRYPPGLKWFYPSTGDFIGLVSNVRSTQACRALKVAFEQSSTFPCHSLSAPGWTVIVGLSDHRSFWRQGYPAVMVTDTAFMRNPHYHQPTDTPDTLNYAKMARVALGIEGALRCLGSL